MCFTVNTCEYIHVHALVYVIIMTGGQEAADFAAQNYMNIFATILSHDEPYPLKLVSTCREIEGCIQHLIVIVHVYLFFTQRYFCTVTTVEVPFVLCYKSVRDIPT